MENHFTKKFAEPTLFVTFFGILYGLWYLFNIVFGWSPLTALLVNLVISIALLNSMMSLYEGLLRTYTDEIIDLFFPFVPKIIGVVGIIGFIVYSYIVGADKIADGLDLFMWELKAVGAYLGSFIIGWMLTVWLLAINMFFLTTLNRNPNSL